MKLTIISFLILLGIQYSEAQVFNTKLRVSVIDAEKKPVNEASIFLYNSNKDYNQSKNLIVMIKTNKNGIGVFKKLNPHAYYLYAEKGTLNNTLGDNETGLLYKGNINQITLSIE